MINGKKVNIEKKKKKKVEAFSGRRFLPDQDRLPTHSTRTARTVYRVNARDANSFKMS